MMERVLFTWSGGKDSAMALYQLQKNNNFEIAALLTTVTQDYDRISMHGTRNILLEQQVKALGLPLERIYITKTSSQQEYEGQMRDRLMNYKNSGVLSVVFGDINLEDLRKYREDNLSKVGMKAVFPIWKKDTAELARAFIKLGFKAVITCIDSNVLDKEFVGREFDERFLDELPPEVDPCGERGEFHSFVYDGPIFRHKILHKKGEVVLREGRFYYCDLMPLE